MSIAAAIAEIGKGFPAPVQVNAAASGALLQQIRQGAPVDVFIPASPDEIDTLAREKRIEPATRTDIAGNRLVLIAPVGSRLRRWEELATPAVTRVALSQPGSAPSGRYAREALTRRGLWAAVSARAVYGESVRQTLAYVAGGDVDAGFVFATDARGEKRVRVVAVAVPSKDHPPIRYQAVVVSGAPSPALARRFVAFLKTPAAQAILARHGFTPPGK